MKFRSILPLFVTSILFGVIFFVQVPNSLAATFSVNSTLDTSDALPGDAVCDDGSGNCTLRGAIEETNALVGADTVNFNIGGGGLQIIAPLTPLPAITQTLNIDGTTQPGYTSSPIIVVDGVNQGFDPILYIFGVSNCLIKGFVLVNGPADGISITMGNQNIIESNYIGIDSTGTIGQGNQNGIDLNGSSQNIIRNNLVSGNLNGITIQDHSSDNILQGNYIGTDITGTSVITPHQYYGVEIYNDYNNNNLIGGSSIGEGNLISGNGVYNSGGGGIAVGTFNILSAGICQDNKIFGNKIGTDITGIIALPNNFGVLAADPSFIGGSSIGEGNLISGNINFGIGIINSFVSVKGNKIGTDVNGILAVPNYDGILISAHNTIIGGNNANDKNLISGNIENGIKIGWGGDQNIIEGNFIGTDISGYSAIPNNQHGIYFSFSNERTLVKNNLISGNKLLGIFIESNFFIYCRGPNQFFGNTIGTNVTGTVSLQNQAGIGIVGSSSCYNEIGGGNLGEGNLISGNLTHGIFLKQSTTNQIKGNKIGTDINGNAPLSNGNTGIFLVDSDANQIGGTVTGEGNLISGNGKSGIQLGFGSDSNEVQGNSVGTNVTGLASIFNRENGILINENSIFNQIGGNTSSARNLISGNQQDGIYIAKANTNVIRGNWIGVNSTGQTQLSNGFSGIRILDASSNVIGGTSVNEGNTIAFNKEAGVTVIRKALATVSNSIRFNSIFENMKLGIDLGNNAVTSNDIKDPDTGPNMFQNYPLVTLVKYVGTNSLQVSSTFNSTPNTTFQVDVYASPAADPSGFGEGKRYLGSTTVTTNSLGNVPPAFPLSLAVPIQIGEYVSMTATDPNGNTSEFSNAKIVN